MPRSDTPQRTAEPSSLSTLTGVRSGKKSYYVELRRTEERMTAAVRTLEGISSALVRTRENPRGLLLEVLHAAAGHLRSRWTMIALSSSALRGFRMRFLALSPSGRIVESDLSLPPALREELKRQRKEASGEPVVRAGWVRVPMTLDGEVLGQLVASPPVDETVEHEDLWVLRILANQAAMSVHTATMYATASDLSGRAQELYDEIARSSEDLQARTAELQRVEGRLRVLSQRELLDAERHRIALELHDSVAQYVLSAGLAVDVCRAEAADNSAAEGTVERLMQARDLIGQAGEQVRSVIYALHHDPADEEIASLPSLLRGLAAQHRPGLAVTVRVEGRPVPLDSKAEHALGRIAGEALFNVSIHGQATRAVVRLRYTDHGISLWISDDGTGDPRELRRKLRLEAAGTSDGRHQGLANMAHRADDLAGTLAIRRSNIGGVRIEVRVESESARVAGDAVRT